MAGGDARPTGMRFPGVGVHGWRAGTPAPPGSVVIENVKGIAWDIQMRP